MSSTSSKRKSKLETSRKRIGKQRGLRLKAPSTWTELSFQIRIDRLCNSHLRKAKLLTRMALQWHNIRATFSNSLRQARKQRKNLQISKTSSRVSSKINRRKQMHRVMHIHSSRIQLRLTAKTLSPSHLRKDSQGLMLPSATMHLKHSCRPNKFLK